MRVCRAGVFVCVFVVRMCSCFLFRTGVFVCVCVCLTGVFVCVSVCLSYGCARVCAFLSYLAGRFGAHAREDLLDRKVAIRIALERQPEAHLRPPVLDTPCGVGHTMLCVRHTRMFARDTICLVLDTRLGFGVEGLGGTSARGPAEAEAPRV